MLVVFLSSIAWLELTTTLFWEECSDLTSLFKPIRLVELRGGLALLMRWCEVGLGE